MHINKDMDYTLEIRKRSPFVNLLGLSVQKLEEGCCRTAMEIKKEFLNKHNIVHGGVIYSMADISMGLAVYFTLEEEEETATIEIKINYLKQAKSKNLLCEARIIQKGKNIAVLEAEIKENSYMIAKAQGTFSISKGKGK